MCAAPLAPPSSNFPNVFSVTASAQHTLLYKELNKFVQQIIKYVLSINRKSDYRLEWQDATITTI